MSASVGAARQFTEMALWTETMRTNSKVFGAVDALEASHDTTATEPTTENDMGEFRAQSMAAVTEAFGDELDSLRKESTFDASKVSALVDSLELGMDIWPAENRRLWLPAPQQQSTPVHASVRLRQ